MSRMVLQLLEIQPEFLLNRKYLTVSVLARVGNIKFFTLCFYRGNILMGALEGVAFLGVFDPIYSGY